MPARRLRCAIEQIVDWHANLFLEPHIVAFVAVAGIETNQRSLEDLAPGGAEPREALVAQTDLGR